jgi:hypothetical protein
MNTGLLSLLFLVLIHLFANKAKVLGWVWHGRFLSFASGISFAYVFVDLLPTLETSQPVLQHTFEQTFPYLNRHTYLIALFGVLFYYGIDAHTQKNRAQGFWIAMSGYFLFNFFVGASLSDSSNPDIQPIILFTLAIGMHYFVHDHNANVDATYLYQHFGRWLLVIGLVLGYVVGYLTHIPDATVALVISFLAGGVFLNVLRYELPKREKVGYAFFVIGALLYAAILLGIGEV